MSQAFQGSVLGSEPPGRPCVQCNEVCEPWEWICSSCRVKPVLRQISPVLACVERGLTCVTCFSGIAQPSTLPFRSYRANPAREPWFNADYFFRVCERCAPANDQIGVSAFREFLGLVLLSDGHA